MIGSIKIIHFLSLLQYLKLIQFKLKKWSLPFQTFVHFSKNVFDSSKKKGNNQLICSTKLQSWNQKFWHIIKWLLNSWNNRYNTAICYIKDTRWYKRICRFYYILRIKLIILTYFIYFILILSHHQPEPEKNLT